MVDGNVADPGIGPPGPRGAGPRLGGVPQETLRVLRGASHAGFHGEGGRSACGETASWGVYQREQRDKEGVQSGRGGSWADGVWGGPGGLGGGWQGGEVASDLWEEAAAPALWSGAPRRGLRVAGREEAGPGGLTVGGEKGGQQRREPGEGGAGTTTWGRHPSREGDVLRKGVSEGSRGLGGMEPGGESVPGGGGPGEAELRGAHTSSNLEARLEWAAERGGGENETGGAASSPDLFCHFFGQTVLFTQSAKGMF